MQLAMNAKKKCHMGMVIGDGDWWLVIGDDGNDKSTNRMLAYL